MEDLQKELDLVKRTRVNHIVKLVGLVISLCITAVGCATLFAVSNFILLKFFSVGWFALMIYGSVLVAKDWIKVINIGSATMHLVETFEQITQENKPLE